jgi:RNA polymerase sigma factor (sigma-70 family)
MATTPLTKVVRRLRSAALGHGADGTDGQLLNRFLNHRDEAAFAALVRRHGPMVWGVCRRAVGNHHDAEDAFQATFLVLVRKAAAVVPREMVANWLYGVAHHTAQKARALANRRRAREKQVKELPEPAAAEPDVWRDLRPLLDQELSRLPDRYRAPVVLCDLEGKTRKEAARQLGLPEGTLSAQLSRARRMLARRLARRGVVLSGGALAGVVSLHATSARVPAAVLEATIQTATLPATAGAISAPVAALTEGVLKTMFLAKLKIVTTVLLLVGTLGGGAGIGLLTQAAGPPEGEPEARSGKLDPGTGRVPRRGAPAQRPDPEALKKATVEGRYSVLLKQIEVKTDRETYTDFHDFGPWSGPSYAGYHDLPAGYWVYVYPHWYIWGAKDGSAEKLLKKASVEGKYSVLLKKLEVKEDRKGYTDFYDYGPWSGASYAGHDDLPPGYWVYVYPHWYIWGKTQGPAHGDLKKASVGGKYRRLLKTIKVPEDRTRYTDFSDYGYCDASAWAGYDDLPPGYWVYVYPHWYIWGEAAKDR